MNPESAEAWNNRSKQPKNKWKFSAQREIVLKRNLDQRKLQQFKNLLGEESKTE